MGGGSGSNKTIFHSMSEIEELISEESKREARRREEERQRKLKEQEEIEKYRQKMNFPAEAERTSSIYIGSGGSQANYVETTTSNKGSTYNRNSKRGTRLVRSR